MTVRGPLTALALAAALFAGGSVLRTTAARAATIATLASVDYRAVVTARPVSSGSAASAIVDVFLYRRTSRSWTLELRRRLPETYFWKTVNAPRALCRLAISTAVPGAGGRGRLIVQLLRSPAVGCGRVFTFGFTSR
jgi:hypothetical protein